MLNNKPLVQCLVFVLLFSLLVWNSAAAQFGMEKHLDEKTLRELEKRVDPPSREQLNRAYKFSNGVTFDEFDVSTVLDYQEELKLSEEQLQKLKKFDRELKKLVAKHYLTKFKRDKLKLIPHMDAKGKFIRASEQCKRALIWKSKYDYYQKTRKTLTPSQRRRLEQILTWGSYCERGRRFSQWTNADVIVLFGLNPDEIRELFEVVGKAEKEFQSRFKKFEANQRTAFLASLTQQQRVKYQRLFDPNRDFGKNKNVNFPPFSLLENCDFLVERNVGMSGEQIRKMEKLSSEYSEKLSQATKGRVTALEHAKAELRVFAEMKEKIRQLYSPRQLAVIEKNYLRRELGYHGPVAVVFADSFIADQIGLSPAAAQAMKKKILKKFKKEDREFARKLTKEGYDNILKTVGANTRKMLKKYFGDPPDFVLGRSPRQ